MTKNTTLSRKNRAYLIAAGWVEDKDSCWLDPKKDAAYHKRNGGHTWPYALKRQGEYDRFAKNLPVYITWPASDQYGYLLKRCIEANGPWLTVWRHHDEATVQKWADQLNKDNTDNLPVFAPDSYEYPYILIFEEKHGSYRYAVPTREDYHRVCLAVVKRRNIEGGWYDYEDESDLDAPALTEAETDKLAKGHIKNAALEEWESYKAQLKQIEADKHERTLLAKALAGNGEAAADFLRARSKGEYEGMELVTLDEVE